MNCFQNCIFTYDSQPVTLNLSHLLVVNCFQNCIFTYDSQLNENLLRVIFCCELLSELYFYLWFPTLHTIGTNPFWLWIAFRIVFLLMIPNAEQLMKLAHNVVNCFQNCIFTYDSQLFIPMIFCICVVNCFQNCIFTYDSQLNIKTGVHITGCELLSELYFYLWFPTGGVFITKCNSLWIAFRIVFLLMIPNRLSAKTLQSFVELNLR